MHSTQTHTHTCTHTGTHVHTHVCSHTHPRTHAYAHKKESLDRHRRQTSWGWMQTVTRCNTASSQAYRYWEAPQVFHITCRSSRAVSYWMGQQQSRFRHREYQAPTVLRWLQSTAANHVEFLPWKMGWVPLSWWSLWCLEHKHHDRCVTSRKGHGRLDCLHLCHENIWLWSSSCTVRCFWGLNSLEES